ncbi:MAG: hypothetical protein CMJ49_11970 [Planctomycetaceae bacterium]|nr:hypothetical protein [Planctomycetaceae bacterium]
MKIETGLLPRIVLQRSRRDLSNAAFTGAAKATGPVQARVSQSGRTVRDAGQTADSTTVKDVLVGDVWIVAGQSNAQGCGLLKNAIKSQPNVRAFYMDDRWRPAKDPIHNMWACVDQIHRDLAAGPLAVDKIRGVGPGVAFAQRMQQNTGVPQGIIAAAHGGTSMEQWDPRKKKLGTRSLYGATIRRFIKNGGKLAGIVWYQGESDALDNTADIYTANMKRLIRSFRRDLADPNLPFVLVQLTSVCGHTDRAKHWNAIQEQQRLLPNTVKRCATVPSIDLPLDDTIHVGGVGQHVLGKRLADAMHVITAPRAAGKPPIALKKISTIRNELMGWADIIVEFDHVVGDLRCGGHRATGFDISDGEHGGHIYDTILDRNRAIVRTDLSHTGLSSMHLHYGRGTFPFCNITDAADRSLPVFGPIRIGKPRALSPFITELRISRVFAGAGDLTTLKRPHPDPAMRWRVRNFADTFCDAQAEFGPTSDDQLMYFACRLHCDEPMKLAAGLGYDGPVKFWVDGKLKFHDPAGTNPAVEDRAVIPFAASKGNHEVIFALGSNNGCAWGIMLRFERTDVTAAQLRQQPARYKMPRIFAT